jgi:PAS domain S-box-containing protein
MIDDITDRKTAQAALQESEERYHSLFTHNHSIMLFIDPADGKIVDANSSACSFYKYSREDLLKRNIADINTLTKEQIFRKMASAMTGEYKSFLFQHRLATGESRDVEVYPGPIKVEGKELLYSIVYDITERKEMEEAIAQREKELEAKARELEEINVALGVLLKRRELDKKELVANIMSNLEELVLPYLEKLKGTRLDEIQRTYVKILESSLAEVSSPFMRGLSERHVNLSPMEVQVANLIKTGRENKEMAEILGVSLNTILTHRYHLRSKLGLKGEKLNLRSYLTSIKL